MVTRYLTAEQVAQLVFQGRVEIGRDATLALQEGEGTRAAAIIVDGVSQLLLRKSAEASSSATRLTDE